MKKLLWTALLTLFLAACGAQGNGTSPGMGMGGGGMMARHHAEVPAEYAGLTNPIPADEASLERGAQLYATNCASCHGEGGMGDGPAAPALNPAPAPVAHTSQMMADDYLFWRISEGGTPFNTSMPPWNSLDEQARWDMINYMRALGEETLPSSGLQAEMLAQAVEQGVTTQAEVDTFNMVHTAMEQYLVGHREVLSNTQSAAERETAILAALVKEQVITQVQAEEFTDIHDRLGASGLMP
jgi:mono/diheme cytochrome c family protein